MPKAKDIDQILQNTKKGKARRFSDEDKKYPGARKKSDDEKLTSTIGVNLTTSEREILKEEAQSFGISEAAFLRMLLKKYIKNK